MTILIDTLNMCNSSEQHTPKIPPLNGFQLYIVDLYL